MTMNNESNTLEGLRVLDLGQVIAGNFCSALLADFGAEVIKIEKPIVGDGIRYMGKTVDGISTSHMVENRGKKCITLNLKAEKGKEIFFELLKNADIVVENFAAGVLERMGLGYDVLEKVNPKIILARISGYGQYGPKSHFYGYDRVAMAYGGITYLTGDPDGPPIRPGVSVSDYMSGLFAALGVMMAIYNRDVIGSGKGQVVDVALFESAFRMIESTVVEYKLFDDTRQRIGNKSNLVIPGNHYLTKDGKWVTIGSGNDKVFERFSKSIGREDWLEDNRYNSQQNRMKPENYSTIDNYCAEWFRNHTEKECAKLLQDSIPYSAILSIDDIFNEEQYKVREDIIEVLQDKIGKVYMQGIMPKMSRTPGNVSWAGASLGAYNEEIYKGLLGMTDVDFKKLKVEGVI